tara:strand:- start:569 stop:799 length:231 start_codon:yes stop_codon:yes gene_type:complete
MNNSNLIKINKIIKKYKNINFKPEDDLFEKGFVDSFDILNIIVDLEKEFKTKLDLTKEKKFVFSVKNLSRKIKSKK